MLFLFSKRHTYIKRCAIAKLLNKCALLSTVCWSSHTKSTQGIKKKCAHKTSCSTMTGHTLFFFTTVSTASTALWKTLISFARCSRFMIMVKPYQYPLAIHRPLFQPICCLRKVWPNVLVKTFQWRNRKRNNTQILFNFVVVAKLDGKCCS